MILQRSPGDGHANGVRSTHTNVGWAVVAMACLQLLNTVVRPHKAAASERQSRARRAWKVLHRANGSFALLLALLNVVLGLLHPYMQSVPSLKSWREALVGLVSAAGALLVVMMLMLVRLSCRRHRAKVAATAYGSDEHRHRMTLGSSGATAKKVSL